MVPREFVVALRRKGYVIQGSDAGNIIVASDMGSYTYDGPVIQKKAAGYHQGFIDWVGDLPNVHKLREKEYEDESGGMTDEDVLDALSGEEQEKFAALLADKAKEAEDTRELEALIAQDAETEDSVAKATPEPPKENSNMSNFEQTVTDALTAMAKEIAALKSAPVAPKPAVTAEYDGPGIGVPRTPISTDPAEEAPLATDMANAIRKDARIAAIEQRHTRIEYTNPKGVEGGPWVGRITGAGSTSLTLLTDNYKGKSTTGLRLRYDRIDYYLDTPNTGVMPEKPAALADVSVEYCIPVTDEGLNGGPQWASNPDALPGYIVVSL